MLILSRREGEPIRIGEDTEIFVTEVKGDKVQLGIPAPESMKISRAELYLIMGNDREVSGKVDLLKVSQPSRNLHQTGQERKQEGRHGNGRENEPVSSRQEGAAPVLWGKSEGDGGAETERAGGA